MIYIADPGLRIPSPCPEGVVGPVIFWRENLSRHNNIQENKTSNSQKKTKKKKKREVSVSVSVSLKTKSRETSLSFQIK